MWFQSKHMSIKAPAEEVSTCRSRGPKCELIEKTYDYVIASRGLWGKITKMEVVGDFDSGPRKAVFIVEQRDKEFLDWRATRFQWWDDARMKKKEDQERQRRNEVTKKIVASMLKDADTVGFEIIRDTVLTFQGSHGKDFGKAVEFGWELKRRQNWDCSQIEDRVEEEDVL